MVIRAAAAALALALSGPAVAWAQNETPPATQAAKDAGNDVAIGIGVIRDSDHHSFAGVRGTGAVNVTESFALVGEAQWATAFSERASSGRIIRDNETTALAGVRYRKFMDSAAVPYVQVAAGYASRIDNGLQIRRSLFALRSCAGLEVPVGNHFGVRAGLGWTYLFVDAPYRHEFGGTIAMTMFLGKR